MSETKRSPDQNSEESTGKKRPSGRLDCAADRILEPNHPLLSFIKRALDIATAAPHSSTWQTIASLLRDQRKIIISYPSSFTEETIYMTIQTYFKELAIGHFKKSRVDWEHASEDELEGFCRKALVKAVSDLVPSKLQVRNSSDKVDQEAVEDVVQNSNNIFILRVNNRAASIRFTQEVIQEFVRPRVKTDPRERDEIIPDDPEEVTMLFVYSQAIQCINISDIEKIYLYLLLLDPEFEDFTIRFTHNGKSFDERPRYLLHEAVRYAIGITFYGPGDLSSKEWRETRRALSKSIASKVSKVLIGKAFKANNKRNRDRSHPDLISMIDQNFETLKVLEPHLIKGTIEPLQRSHEQVAHLKFPKAAIDSLIEKAERLGKTNDTLFCGLMNILTAKRHPDQGEGGDDKHS